MFPYDFEQLYISHNITNSWFQFSVHPTDATRLDLIIPGEAHFYVKAATPQERQQWLVALGSSKAGLAAPNGVPRQMSGDWSKLNLVDLFRNVLVVFWYGKFPAFGQDYITLFKILDSQVQQFR